jgi:hydrogenase maturation protein HypF
MKGAFALAKGDTAHLFEGFGDLSDIDNFTRYGNAIKSALRKFKIGSAIVICDLHPGYFSAQFAHSLANPVKVQHHEAHVASAIIDSGLKGDVFAAAFDGTGYGWDGNIWGGEFFKGSLKNMRRARHLDYMPMPGGDACAKNPWRMAVSYLYKAFGADFIKLKLGILKDVDRKKLAVLKDMMDKRMNSPLTSSMGRFFDAVASIVLNKGVAKYEAQLPIELERMAASGIDSHYGSGGSIRILKGVVRDVKRCERASVISAKFHNSIAHMILDAAQISKIKNVVLTGGVFQNNYLKDKTIGLLSKNGFKVYTHSKIETNDNGIPIGQIAIAHSRGLCA